MIYPYLLGYLFNLLVHPLLLDGVPPSLHREAYLLRCQSISFRCTFDHLEIICEKLIWENPKSYLEFHQVPHPKNFLEISSLRGLISWSHLIPYLQSRCETALRIKELSIQHVKVHVMKQRNLLSLNVLTAMGMPQQKDQPLPPTIPTETTDQSSSTIPPISPMFLYYDISFLLITKLHIICHDLLDPTNTLLCARSTTRALVSTTEQIDLILPDIIFHRNQLTKKFSKEKRNRLKNQILHRDRKVYSIYELPVIIGKRIGLKLLRCNREAVVKILRSGILGPILKFLKKKKKRIQKVLRK